MMSWFSVQIILIVLSVFLTSPINAACTGTLTGSNTVDDFTVKMTMDCANEKIKIQIDYNNYHDNWFGLVFHHSMTPHPSLCYTTGKQADKDASLYYYYLKSKSESYITYQQENDWTELTKTVSNGHVQLIYEQDLSNTEWDTSTDQIGFSFASGSSLKLTEHTHTYDHVYITFPNSDSGSTSTTTKKPNSGSSTSSNSLNSSTITMIVVIALSVVAIPLVILLIAWFVLKKINEKDEKKIKLMVEENNEMDIDDNNNNDDKTDKLL